METFDLIVNGEARQVEADGDTPLVFVLRNQLKLFGAKLGCGLEQCGACAVLLDGAPAFSCTLQIAQAQGREVITIEGLARDGRLSLIQQAFIDHNAAQCGFCTAGMLIGASALLERTASPDDNAIRAALEPHLCRCGTHARIIEAVRACGGKS